MTIETVETNTPAKKSKIAGAPAKSKVKPAVESLEAALETAPKKAPVKAAPVKAPPHGHEKGKKSTCRFDHYSDARD